MTLMFKPGETYRTRDGREARVYAVDGSDPYCIHGALLEKSGWRPTGWTTAGRYFAWDEESDCDLLPPAPLTSVDEASRYAAAWLAGAEAMRAEFLAWAAPRSRHIEQVVRSLPTPPLPPGPAPERLSGEYWINVEPAAAFLHATRGLADLYATGDRIACIRIDLSQHRKGEGL